MVITTIGSNYVQVKLSRISDAVRGKINIGEQNYQELLDRNSELF